MALLQVKYGALLAARNGLPLLVHVYIRVRTVNTLKFAQLPQKHVPLTRTRFSVMTGRSCNHHQPCKLLHQWSYAPSSYLLNHLVRQREQRLRRSTYRLKLLNRHASCRGDHVCAMRLAPNGDDVTESCDVMYFMITRYMKCSCQADTNIYFYLLCTHNTTVKPLFLSIMVGLPLLYISEITNPTGARR